MDVRGRMPIMPPIPEFGPVALATQLGAPVALLVTPKGLCQIGGVSTDSVHRFGRSPQLPVRVEINYRFDSDDLFAPAPSIGVLAYTRRQQPDLPGVLLREHTETALVDYQFAFGARTDSPPWAAEQGGRLRPPKLLMERLLHPRIGWRYKPVTVDGQEQSWDYLAEPDIAIAIDEMVVAIAGPERLLASGVSIAMVHP